MQVKCWNCGTEMEKSGVQEYKFSLRNVINKLYDTHKTIGDTYKASAYEDVLYILDNYDN